MKMGTASDYVMPRAERSSVRRNERKKRKKTERRQQRYGFSILSRSNTYCRLQKAATREGRIKKLVENLERKLGIFTESATGPNDRDVTSSWRTICELEAE